MSGGSSWLTYTSNGLHQQGVGGQPSDPRVSRSGLGGGNGDNLGHKAKASGRAHDK